MLIFDINSFPKGLNLSVWMEMHNKGIALYDSLSGKEPLKIDDQELSLIDINTVDNEELQKISDFVEAKLKEDNLQKIESVKTLRENNKKLIDYLKRVNNETI
jgi:hypothetical protein